MDAFYIGLFFLEGFGSVTLGFSSTYFATECSEIAWGIAENFELNLIPQATNKEYDPFIDNSTTFLKEVDPLFKNCLDSLSEYQNGAKAYDKAFSEFVFLVINILYHTENIYESGLLTRDMIESANETEVGIEGQDSQYYQVLGKQIGKIFYYTFYDLGDFSYPDIEIDYPTDFDDESLEFFN